VIENDSLERLLLELKTDPIERMPLELFPYFNGGCKNVHTNCKYVNTGFSKLKKEVIAPRLFRVSL